MFWIKNDALRVPADTFSGILPALLLQVSSSQTNYSNVVSRAFVVTLFYQFENVPSTTPNI